jgi:hypothetical protein
MASEALDLLKNPYVQVGLAVGFGALASNAGRLASVAERIIAPLVSKTPEVTAAARELFLKDAYLQQPYVMPEAIKGTLERTAAELQQKFPEFNSLVTVGGTTNGSLALRMLEHGNTASDLDFYLVGRSTTPDRLNAMASLVSQRARSLGLGTDGVFSGRDPRKYLNLDRLDLHADRGDYHLLTLPFRNTFGDSRSAMTSVLETISKRPDKQEIWNEIRNVHAQSLSMHHGSWSLDFNNQILSDFYPLKIEKFGLPDTAEKMMARLHQV